MTQEAIKHNKINVYLIFESKRYFFTCECLNLSYFEESEESEILTKCKLLYVIPYFIISSNLTENYCK